MLYENMVQKIQNNPTVQIGNVLKVQNQQRTKKQTEEYAKSQYREGVKRDAK